MASIMPSADLLSGSKSRCLQPFTLRRPRVFVSSQRRPDVKSSAALFSPASAEAVSLTKQQLLDVLAPASHPLTLDLGSPWGFLQANAPSPFAVLSFLLSNPLVTFGLAVFLYFTVPRLWRAFLKFIVLPASILAGGYVVFKNPQSFSNAGSFIGNFTHDHPYVTSGTILVGLTLLLSPYLLTALLLLFLATGIPRLPQPLQRFLPEPVVEFEQQLANISDVTRGPVDSIKEQAAKFTSELTSSGGQFFQKKISEAPALSQSLKRE